MKDENVIAFGPFRLDLQRQRLLRLDVDLHLRPKVWDVLTYLARRPGVVVSSRELIDILWPDVAVTPNALTRVVSELRQVLGGKEASDKYLRTLPKRGFLFTAGSVTADAIAEPIIPASNENASLIGREEELAELARVWRLAVDGRRQVVFVSGEPGIGKTTLVDAAVGRIATSSGRPLSVKGQCLPLQGESEPFLPIAEAVEQLLDELGDGAFVDLARRYAPTWLVQMPWLLEADELAHLRRTLSTSGSQRVLRDAVRLLERVSEQSPLLLVLEDVQWADSGTLDLLVTLAERSTSARLMVIATYRAIEVSLTGHPIGAAAHSLCSRAKAIALEIDAWSRRGVAAYLDRRFGSTEITAALTARLEAHTHGNPLFVQETVDHLVRTGHLRQAGGHWQRDLQTQPQHLALPGSVRNTVEAWLTRQPPLTVEALEAASLIDGEFTVQEVAAALGRTDIDIDEAFSAIERRSRLVQLVGTGRWPDSTTTLAYRFSHALYQRALAERVAPLRRQELHRGIATRLEAGFQGDTGRVATRLATHFEACGDEDKRVTYLETAAGVARRRYAFAEAAGHLRKVIDSLQQRPESADHRRREARRWIDYSTLQHTAQGLGNLDSRAGFEQALKLAGGLDDSQLRFAALLGLCFNLGFSGELDRAMPVNEQLVELAEATNRQLLPIAHLYMAMTETSLGYFQRARERALTAMTMEGMAGVTEGWSLAVGCQAQAMVCCGLLGVTAALDAEVEQVLNRAQASRLPADRLIGFTYGAAAYAMQRDWTRASALALQSVPLADELAQPTYQTLARLLEARARAPVPTPTFIEEVEAQLRQREALGERWWSSWFRGWLAEAYQRAGDLDAALAQTDLALGHQEQVFRSETWRIRGALLGAQGRDDEAEACLREALAIAQAQGAQIFTLRAALELGRTLKKQSRGAEAQQLLKRVATKSAGARGSLDLAEARAELRSFQ